MIYKLTCAWLVFLSVVVVTLPEVLGAWQARVEMGFLNEAENIKLWSE